MNKKHNLLIFNESTIFNQKKHQRKRFLCVAEYQVVGNMNLVGRTLTRNGKAKDSYLQEEDSVIQDE